MVKISGFEINKKITVKLNLINKSKFSERVIILSPTTPYFKIKCLKRGLIPPGLSEIIYVSFTPQNYQLYSDSIKINCPGDKIIIPINAYPRMNIFVKDYIPKTIDLGNIIIDTIHEKEIKMKNIIDIPFNYTITPIKTIEEICLSPLENDVKAFSSRSIIIKFAPKKYGFFRGEYKFIINEYDFCPYVFSIIGTCNTFDIRCGNQIEGLLNSKEILLKKNCNKVDLNFHTFNHNNQPLENYINQSNKDEEQKIEDEKERQGIERPLSKTIQKFKDFPSNKEREYLMFFNNSENVIQAKEFKYIPFIGKELLTENEIKKIIKDRYNEKDTKLNTLCQIDKDRHQIEYDKEKSEIKKYLKYYLKPNFNSNQNENFFKTRHYFKLFLKGMTKVIIRKRAEKNINQLKKMIDKNNIKSRDDFKKYVEQNWIDYYSKDQREADDDISFNFLKMKFFNSSFLFREQVYLTNEYSIDSLKQKISHDNNINLEEYMEYEQLERNDLEVIGYNSFVSPGITQFDINLGEKTMRPGCNTDNLIRDERGDTEITFDKTSFLFEISDEFSKHINFQAEDIVFNHPGLKRYVSLNITTENSIDYNLQPKKYKTKEEKVSNYLNELYMKTNLSYCDNGQIPMKQIDDDYLLCDFTLNFIPKKLKALDPKDLNIKMNEKVDEDNLLYELIQEDENQLIEFFEKEDESVSKIRQINKNETINMKKIGQKVMENSFQIHKKKWMAIVPTLFEYYNSGMLYSNNKLLI